MIAQRLPPRSDDRGRRRGERRLGADGHGDRRSPEKRGLGGVGRRADSHDRSARRGRGEVLGGLGGLVVPGDGGGLEGGDEGLDRVVVGQVGKSIRQADR
jgi:hypothetical protein